MSEFNSKIIKSLCLLIFLNGCAYFNTFYNAKSSFEIAENMRINEIETENINFNYYYKKAIEKSDIVIKDFSKSKYVEEARFIKAKSLYFLNKFEESNAIFSQILISTNSEFFSEAKYWQSMIKYNNNQNIEAINDLRKLFNETKKNDLKSQILLSLGEIYLNNYDYENAYLNFKKGINLSSDKVLKEKIHFNLANSAFDRGNFLESKENYEAVIKLSSSYERIFMSQLKIVEILRIQKDFEGASKKVKTLLLNEDFSANRGELELEFLKIEKSLGNTQYVIDNLDLLSQEYRGSLIAAEANFILSEIFLSNNFKDYEKSRFFLNEILSQDNNSKFKSYAEKNKFNVNRLISYEKNISENINRDKNIYKSGEILAFNLKQVDSSKSYFKNVISDYYESQYFIKALFAMYLIEESFEQKKYYSSIILNDFKNSNYAKFIIENEKLDIEFLPESMLMSAENQLNLDPLIFLESYKNISSIEGISDQIKKANYFLANYYHFNDVKIDSARFYYNKVVTDYPSSKQAEISLERLKGFSNE